MDRNEWLAERLEAQRTRMPAVAERMRMLASLGRRLRAAPVAPAPKPTRRTAAGPKIPFYALRHTALTRLAEVVQRHVVQAIAGHAPGDVTDGYLHATEAEMRRRSSGWRRN
jgi:integrase